MGHLKYNGSEFPPSNVIELGIGPKPIGPRTSITLEEGNLNSERPVVMFLKFPY